MSFTRVSKHIHAMWHTFGTDRQTSDCFSSFYYVEMAPFSLDSLLCFSCTVARFLSELLLSNGQVVVQQVQLSHFDNFLPLFGVVLPHYGVACWLRRHIYVH